MNNESERPNPLVSFVLTDEEYKALERTAKYYGVSVAQVARGFMRMGLGRQSQDGNLKAVQSGRFDAQ